MWTFTIQFHDDKGSTVLHTCKYTTIYSIFFLEELIIYVCICVKVLCIEFLNEWTENNPHLSSSLHLALHSTHHIISVLYPSLIFKNPLLLLGSHSITVNSLMSKYPSLRFFFSILQISNVIRHLGEGAATH